MSAIAPCESFTTTKVTPAGRSSGRRSQTTAAAPAVTAAPMKAWPSHCVPGTAKKQQPAAAARES